MRKDYFAKLVRYMKNVYHIENGLNKLSDGRVNPKYNTAQVITLVLLDLLLRILVTYLGWCQCYSSHLSREPKSVI